MEMNINFFDINTAQKKLYKMEKNMQLTETGHTGKTAACQQ